MRFVTVHRIVAKKVEGREMMKNRELSETRHFCGRYLERRRDYSTLDGWPLSSYEAGFEGMRRGGGWRRPQTVPPVWQGWWPPGHMIDWEQAGVHEVHHSLLRLIVDETAVGSYGATFEHGHRAGEVRYAIARWARSGERGDVRYRLRREVV